MLDEDRVHTLADGRDRLVDEGADDTTGEEAAAVVDHDRGLTNLQRVVDDLGQHLIRGLLTADDLHQRHLVHRREEVDADEVLLPLDPLREAGDRQGRGVGTQDGVRLDDVLDLLEDLVLHVNRLEGGFDDQVDTLEIGGVDGRVDPAEQRVALLLGGLALGECLLLELLGVALALLGGVEVDVLEHDLHAGLGRYVGDRGTHHACADHTDLLGGVLLDSLGARAATVDVLQVEEERLDHVLRDLTGHQRDEVAGLDDVGGVDVDVGTFDGGGQDGARSRHVGALDLLAQQRRQCRQVLGERRVGGSTTRDLVALLVPRLRGFRILLDPCLGGRDQFLDGADDLVDQSGLLGLGRVEPLPLQQHTHQRILDTEQTHGTDHATATGQQAESCLGQTDLDTLDIGCDAVVGVQRDLQATAERGTVDRGDDRLAEGLEAPHDLLHGVGALGDRGGDLFLRLRAAVAAHVFQVAAGEEGLLGRGEHDTGDVVLLGLEALDDGRQRGHEQVVHGVGALVRVVHGQDNDPVGVLLPIEHVVTHGV